MAMVLESNPISQLRAWCWILEISLPNCPLGDNKLRQLSSGVTSQPYKPHKLVYSRGMAVISLDIAVGQTDSTFGIFLARPLSSNSHPGNIFRSMRKLTTFSDPTFYFCPPRSPHQVPRINQRFSSLVRRIRPSFPTRLLL